MEELHLSTSRIVGSKAIQSESGGRVSAQFMEWWTQAGEEWKPVWINCEAELVMDVPATRGAPDTDYPFEDRQKVQTKFAKVIKQVGPCLCWA